MLAAAALGAFSGGSAGAEKPDASAYWVRTQNSSLPGQPPNPEVPPGDLSVVNDPSASATTPIAYSAVRLVAPGSTSATLLLTLADVSTASTVAVSACTVDAPWEATPDGGPGPYDKAPTFVAGSCINGIATSDGTGFTFALGPAQQTAPDVYDVAIVPTPSVPPPPPFSATFAQPDQQSFTVFEGTSPESAADEAAAPADPVAAQPPADFSGSSFTTPAAGATFTAAPAAPAEPSAPAAAPAAPTLRAPDRPVPAVALPPAADKRWQRFMAVGLLLAMAAAMWFVVGQPSHTPRLLGALTGRRATPAFDGDSESPLGGIGRFAKPRVGKPRRLF
jgi:hypothetical protein